MDARKYITYTCAEGVTNDLLWVWLHIEWWAMGSTGFALAKLIMIELFWTLLAMIMLYGVVYRLGIINQVRNVGTSVIHGQRGLENRGCTVVYARTACYLYSQNAPEGTSEYLKPKIFLGVDPPRCGAHQLPWLLLILLVLVQYWPY